MINLSLLATELARITTCQQIVRGLLDAKWDIFHAQIYFYDIIMYFLLLINEP